MHNIDCSLVIMHELIMREVNYYYVSYQFSIFPVIVRDTLNNCLI